jgi:SAM-dependent methyltransferase
MALAGDPRGVTTHSTPSPAPRIANTAQAAAWNGPEGANWADGSTTGAIDDGLIGPILDISGIADGDRVLDIGCGTGDMTRLAAVRAGRGRATGVDLSSAMVARATAIAAAEGIANVDFVEGDVQVHPFAAGGYDVAVSHFGIMFFDDPGAAFANVARALRPGGRLAFVCPQAMELCDWYVVPLAALLGHPPSAEEALSLMFSLAEPSTVDWLLGGTGFVDVRIDPVDAALRLGPDVDATVGFYAGSGPMRALLERQPDLTEDRARNLLAAALAPYGGDDGVRIPGAHWLVTATRSTP